jgi:hypothetical protein
VQRASAANALVRTALTAYGAFTARAAGLRRATNLDVAIARALEWYRHARFEPNAAVRFMSCYIGLEQVFVRGGEEPFSQLLSRASALLGCWSLAPGPGAAYGNLVATVVREFWQHARAMPAVGRALDTIRAFDGWHETMRLLLNPAALDALVPLLPPDEELKALRAALALILSTESSQRTMEATYRQRLEFRLSQLMERRNAIVHEALTGSVDMELYAEALEGIFTSLLDLLLDCTNAEPPAATTLEEAILWVSPPWRN